MLTVLEFLHEEKYRYVSESPFWERELRSDTSENIDKSRLRIYQLTGSRSEDSSKIRQVLEQLLDSMQEFSTMLFVVLEGGEKLQYYIGYLSPMEIDFETIDKLWIRRFSVIYEEASVRVLCEVECQNLWERMRSQRHAAIFENVPTKLESGNSLVYPCDEIANLLTDEPFYLQLLLRPISVKEREDLRKDLQLFGDTLAALTVRTVSRQSVTNCSNAIRIQAKKKQEIPDEEACLVLEPFELNGHATQTNTCTRTFSQSLIDLTASSWQNYVSNTLYPRWTRGSDYGLYSYQMIGYAQRVGTLWLLKQALRCRSNPMEPSLAPTHMHCLEMEDERVHECLALHLPNYHCKKVLGKEQLNRSLCTACSQWNGSYWLSGFELCDYLMPPKKI